MLRASSFKKGLKSSERQSRKESKRKKLFRYDENALYDRGLRHHKATRGNLYRVLKLHILVAMSYFRSNDELYHEKKF